MDKKKKRIITTVVLLILLIILIIILCLLLIKPRCEVTFESNGGSRVSSCKVKIGKLIKEPIAPTKDGFTFIGWFSDSELTKEWNFETDKVEKDLTLYAKWDDEVDPTLNDTTFEVEFLCGKTTITTEKVKGNKKPKGELFFGDNVSAKYFIDEEKTIPFDFDRIIKSDKKVYVELSVLNYGASPKEFTYEDVFDFSSIDNGTHYEIERASTYDNFLTSCIIIPTKYDGKEITSFSTVLGSCNSWGVDMFADVILVVQDNIKYIEKGALVGSGVYFETEPTNYADAFEFWGDPNMYHKWECGTFGNIKGVPFVQNGLAYVIQGDNAILVNGDKTSSECTVPEKITVNGKDYPVTAIGHLAFIYAKASKINIPSSVEEIGERAFYDCDNLTEISLPKTLPEIRHLTFGNCDSLTEITIPSSVKEIGNGAFGECPKLKNVFFEEGIELKEIQQYVFGDCTSLTEIIIPKSVEKIVLRAFENCEKLTSVTFESGSMLKELSGFGHCVSLEQIELPEGLENIDSGAFRNCENLKKVSIPNSIEYIEGGAFEGTSIETNYIDGGYYLGNEENKNLVLCKIDEEITDFTIAEGTKILCDNVFLYSELTSVTIPEGIVAIGDGVFYACSNLEEVNLPSSLKYIGEYAFTSCEKLTSITIPSSVVCIDFSAFEYSGLATVTFESDSNLKRIGEYTFKDCDSLTEITIPSSVKEIGWYAFQNCKSLTKINIPKNVEKIKVFTFSGCSSLNSVTFEEDSKLEYIYENAFTGCESLSEITIPKSVCFIGEKAFSDCNNLKNVIITADSVLKKIDVDAFSGCTSLEKISLENARILKDIDDRAFSGCVNLKDIVVLKNVTRMGENAFDGCGLTTINVEEIESNVLANKSWNKNWLGDTNATINWGYVI